MDNDGMALLMTHEPAPSQTARVPFIQRYRPLLIPLLLIALVGVAFALRAWSLNSLPPGLWWDEASQGLDARDLLNGQFRVFFPRAEGKEPLYIYLTTPFVAAWNGQPFAVRLAGAVLGALMVLVLYLAGRALWRQQPDVGRWVGLVAAGLWAFNYWPQSMNRVGFQVNAFPIVITLAVVMWLNWSHRPTRDRALAFGVLAGLTLATYLAARFTVLIWPVLYLALPAARRRALRSTLLWVFFGFSLTAIPLGIHFALHPNDFFNRANVFPLLRGDYGKELLEPLVSSAKDVAGAFLGWSGDPNYRHNIPGRPAFSPALAVLFGLGVGAAILSLRRRNDPRGWTLLTWLLVLSVPSVLSLVSNPHYPRLFGALPAALLLVAWPIVALARRIAVRGPVWRGAAILGVTLLLTTEGVHTTYDYFVTWRQIDLYEAFNGDTMLLGERIRATPEAIAVVPIYGDATHVLDYAFPRTPIFEVALNEETIGPWLENHLSKAGGKQVLVPVWTIEPQTYADAQQAVPFYLQREGRPVTEEHHRNFDLRGYTLGEQPAFTATGNQVTLDRSFSEDVKLLEARWGAAYPNLDRNSTTASAGTAFWVILTWQLQRPYTNLRTAVDLVDEDGHRLSHADQQLVHVAQDPPPDWAPNTLVRTYHLIDVPATQLPGPVTLEARLYDSGTLLPLLPANATAQGSIIVDHASSSAPVELPLAAPLQPSHPLDISFRAGLTLLGMDDGSTTVQPGSPLALRLYWQTEQSLPGDQEFIISVSETNITTTVQLPAHMPVGHPVHTYVDLRLPPDIGSGVHTLWLRPSGAESQPVVLGPVEVSGRPRQFDVPVLESPVHASFGQQVALLGTNTPSPLLTAPGLTVTVTLAWQPLITPSQDLVRFVHLLGPDGLPVAQQDGRPCAGACPASSWLPGEVLSEEVQLSIPANLPTGTYRLAVGWYDAATLQRLAAVDETDQALPDNLLVLPINVAVKP